MATLIPIFIEALPSLIAAGESLVSYISSMKTALSQSSEWTAENDAQWQAALLAAGKDPEWLA